VGSDFPIPCAPGTYQNEFGNDTCKICPSGFFCTINTSAPFECPIGHYCPDGTKYANEFPCEAGSYSPFRGAGECLQCPAGQWCDYGSIIPADCEVPYFCPAGINDPILCLNGTYGVSVNTSAADECTECPGGSYCVDGRISGLCEPGYFCRSGQDSPTPVHDISALGDAYEQLLFLDAELGGQCPPGHYCPLGNSVPISCPNTTVRLTTYGTGPTDCSPCPAGYRCYEGNPIPEACEKGYYCEYGEPPVACPRFRYNEYIAQTTPDDCFPCPAGFLCNSTGIGDFRQYPCPPGFFCTNSTSEIEACPAGTYRDDPGAAKIEHCHECPGGSFCPRQTDVHYSCPKVRSQLSYHMSTHIYIHIYRYICIHVS
jgi:hypothetical protein